MNEASRVRSALIDGDGYVCLPEVISPREAGEVRARLLERIGDGQTLEEGVIGMANLERILPWDVFERLATQPRLLAAAHALLGEDATLAAFSARVLMSGCAPGRVHVDWPYWGMEPGMPVDPPLMMQVIWMMEPFSPGNGSTRVAAGSQRWGGIPDAERFEQSMCQVSGAAGDAILSHGLLWHQTAVNRSSQPRVAILINYSQFVVRPLREPGPFTEEQTANASPALRRLLLLDRQESIRRRLSRFSTTRR
ncbi:MAG: phytanoyl-CoA dioxygenase family protein [Pseudomonadales bacterium]|jgi:hypothetical protein